MHLPGIIPTVVDAGTAARSFSLAHSSIVFSWFVRNGFIIG